MPAMERIGAEGMRRRDRIRQEIAILLTGCNVEGKAFVERTKTVILSRHGAGIVSRHKLVVDQELIVVDLESNKEAAIRVVGHFGSAEGSYTYGVAFLDPHPDFWSVEFPSEAGAEGSECSRTLQCSICGCREVMAPGALDWDIYAIHGAILRNCPRCKQSTVWKQAFHEPPGSFASSDAKPISSELFFAAGRYPTTAPFRDRRGDPRTRVNFNACVRTPASEQSIVPCENVSRGGLCFMSSKRYEAGAHIEIAAPYSPGCPRKLVPAEIVYIQELAAGKVFRCGVRYLPITKSPQAA